MSISSYRLQPIEIFDREDYNVDRKQHPLSSSIDAFCPFAAAVMSCQISPITNVRLELLLPLHLRRRQINVASLEPFEWLSSSLSTSITGLTHMYIHFKLEQLLLLLFEGSLTQMQLRRRVIDVVGDI